MKSTVLKDELLTFKKNKNNLLREHSGKYVLISKTKIIGTFDSFNDAANEGFRAVGIRPFLVKELVEEEEKAVISSVFVKRD
jgi:hypothetical protein